MSPPRQATAEELRIAEMAVALVETRIREHMEHCTYCDQGPNAYNQADRAVAAAFEDVRKAFATIRRDIARAEKRERARALEKTAGEFDLLRIRLVYPTRRSVSPAQIVSWWDDAVANGEIDASCYDPEPTLREAIADLENLGHITERK